LANFNLLTEASDNALSIALEFLYFLC